MIDDLFKFLDKLMKGLVILLFIAIIGSAFSILSDFITNTTNGSNVILGAIFFLVFMVICGFMLGTTLRILYKIIKWAYT